MADGPGRPRSFDVEKAIDEALALFWQRGYLGTSYADICVATGFSKPSLYATLGNKEATFLTVLDLYVSRYVQPGIELLKHEPNGNKAVRKLLVATVEGLTAKDLPLGCFITINASCSDTPQVPAAVAEALRTAAARTHSAIAVRLDRALDDNQLPRDTDTGALTCFFDTLVAGLSALAKQGAPKQDLIRAVHTAMLVWPSRTT